MNPDAMIERLAALPNLADIPRAQLQWLLDHGTYRTDSDGAVYRTDGTPVPLGLCLLISGRFSVRVDQGGTEREVREVTPGRVTGYLPYSRMVTGRGYLVADGPVELLIIATEDIPEMTRQCYEFTALCVHEMLDRVRTFKADDKRQEKMAALGRLSAGLAHELNNPASAAASAARSMDRARRELVAAARELGAAGLAEDALRALGELESAAGREEEPPSFFELGAREDAIAAWLDDRDLDPEPADALAESGLTVADLDAAAPAFDAGQLAPALRYVLADHALRGLTADMASAADRIHSLVAAVKKHTHMDRAPTAEPVGIAEHLADTVTLMHAKALLKGAVVELDVEPDLPPVEATVSDLNQVWMHLLDNAIDAVEEAGRIAITGSRDGERVVVRIADDGPGIPPDLQERVFDPFFTTKEVGEGRGLGLDIVRTVVLDHRGTIALTSTPGRTEFCISLPAADARGEDGVARDEE